MATSSEMKRISSGKRSLQHPLHKHALNLRELSEDCQVECHFCKQRFHGLVYCCEECDFILHEACAQIEFPPVIQEHPSHRPDHPLNLVQEKRSYCCSDCRFSLDALTAIAICLPSQGIEEDIIRHFRHEEHPLSSFRVETVLEVLCGYCSQQISGQVYGCRPCLFFLHEACARLTREIQHPLHRQHPLSLFAVRAQDMCICQVCLRYLESGPAYCCEECGFTLHDKCTVLTMDAQNDTRKDCDIEHHSHKHPLTPIHVGEMFQSHMRCSVCRLNISGAEAFACPDCRFFLHKSCAEELPEEIQHFLHPQHPHLVLRLEDPHQTRSLEFKCSSCMENRYNLAFSCKDCDFNLDPACALQTLAAVEDGAAPYISHFAHEHPLTLAFRKSGIKRTCIACKQPIDGVAYCCTTCERFSLHRSCAELPFKMEHAFHSQHPLLLSEAPARYFFCNACHEKSECLMYYGSEKYDGLAFYCAECQFYMDVGCASLNPTLKHPLHEHRLAYCESNSTKQLHCSCCGKRCRYDFWCCMPCDFSLHRDCLHLPTTVDHKSHYWHQLQLCDKFVYGDPNEQYCDYCETIRNPDHGVYKCEECIFSAHIECMISDCEDEASGTDRRNQLNIEIGSLKAKMEIMRRDLEATRANLAASVEILEEIENNGEGSLEPPGAA